MENEVNIQKAKNVYINNHCFSKNKKYCLFGKQVL